MQIRQRDIVEVPFNLPQGTENHPAIVLSSDDAITAEGAFIAIMLTSNAIDDLYSFPISDAMFNKKMSKITQARLHLMGFFSCEDVIKNSHPGVQMRKDRFNDLIKRICEVTFDVVPDHLK